MVAILSSLALTAAVASMAHAQTYGSASYSSAAPASSSQAPPPPAPPASHYSQGGAPSNSYSGAPSSTEVNPNRATHRVIAGFNGLHFEPENIVAEIGDLVEVHFNPMNHSFAQSSFQKPCVPINDDAIFSGFRPSMQGENPEVFTITIEDQEPKWFYCAQTKGYHCQMGMSMVVNQNFNSPNTLAAYQAASKLTGKSIAPPKVGNGGTLTPPPNGPGL